MWMRAILVIGLILLSHSAVSAQSTGGGTTSDGIRLGAVFNVSGEQEVLGQPGWVGASLAAANINAGGGVLGRPVTLYHIEGDSVAADIGTAVEAALARDGELIALFGLADTDLALAAGKAAAAARAVFLTSGATSPRLPAEVPQYLFLACFGDNVQAAAAAEWAYGARNARRIHVLFERGPTYPQILKDYFVTRFEELGGTIVAVDPVDPAAPGPAASRVAAPDMVFLSVETAQEAVPAIAALREAGYDGPILGGDGYDATSVWSAHRQVSNVFFTTHVYLGPDSSDPRVAAFVEAFRAMTHEEPGAFAALAYDSVGLLAEALANAGSAARDKVGEGLLAIDAYEGLTGTISYAGGAHVPKKSVTILAVRDGRQTLVETVMPQKVPPP